ncbi:MAG: succinate dehydrogenase assembly factor 2 [Cyphobasidiales sp. Tagirdzhanova-0007]|nr:MAG: succinate dehydrogenase assembly factor 2 [Cyphobasidiales sp. Tagirdzhanova-0007]
MSMLSRRMLVASGRATAYRSLPSIRHSSSSSSKDKSTAPSMADDPWALPLQYPGTMPEDIPRVQGANSQTSHPEGRSDNEETETMRARLVYQSRKRGILETDLLLSTFIDSGKLKNMSRTEMEEYDRLLTLPDWTIYYYAIGKKTPPPDSEWAKSKVLAELSKHSANEGKEVRQMPKLSSYDIGSVEQK